MAISFLRCFSEGLIITFLNFQALVPKPTRPCFIKSFNNNKFKTPISPKGTRSDTKILLAF